jgi:hypothetical protein
MPKFDIRKRAPTTIKTKAKIFERIACLSPQLFLDKHMPRKIFNQEHSPHKVVEDWFAV